MKKSNNLLKLQKTFSKISLSIFCLISNFLMAQKLVDKEQIHEHNQNYFEVSNILDVKASSIEYYKFTPFVVEETSKKPILLEVKMTGNITKIIFVRLNNSSEELNDNGLNGDFKGNDMIYSLNVNPTASKWEKHLGYLDVYNGTQRIIRLNLFIPIINDKIEIVTPKKISEKTQVTDYIFNVALNEIAIPKDFSVLDYKIGQLFYENHLDEYDFLNVVYAIGGLQNSFHYSLSNNISGIGREKFDNSKLYTGTNSNNTRLKGLLEFHYPTVFDPVNNVYLHELGHYWINYLEMANLKDLGQHFPLSNIAANGIMGISIPGSKIGGNLSKRFTLRNDGIGIDDFYDTKTLYNNWELYMMGLISKADLTPAYILKDQSYPIKNGLYNYSDFIEITPEKLVSQIGERIPNFNDTQKIFKTATIVISDSLLSKNEISYFNYMAKRAELEEEANVQVGLVSYLGKPFYLATQGKGKLTSKLNTIYCTKSEQNLKILVDEQFYVNDSTIAFCDIYNQSLKLSKQGVATNWYKENDQFYNLKIDNSINISEPGTYYYTIKDSLGCIHKSIKTRIIDAKIEVPVITTDSQAICKGNSSLLKTNSGHEKYEWIRFNEVFETTNVSEIKVKNGGNYRVVVISKYGGCKRISDIINIQEYPLNTNKPSIIYSKNVLCSTNDNFFIKSGIKGLNHNWYYNNQILTSHIDSISINKKGFYQVSVSDLNGCFSKKSDSLEIISVDVTPPIITQTNDYISTSTVSDKYQWFYNDNELINQNFQKIIPNLPGTYYLKITNLGCSSFSNKIDYIILSTETQESENHVICFPNPNSGIINLKFIGNKIPKNISIYNLQGLQIFSTDNNIKIESILLNIADGIYFLKAQFEDKIQIQKISIQK